MLIEASRLDAMDGDLDAAARKLRRAVERAPNDADNLAVAAWSAPERAPLAAEAVAWADRALALNPERPDWYMAAKGQAAFAAGDDAGAIAALKQGPKDYLDGWVMIAEAAANLGEPAQAEAAAAEVRRLSPDFDLEVYLGGWPWEPTFSAPPARGRHARRPRSLTTGAREPDFRRPVKKWQAQIPATFQPDSSRRK